jgi:hypothetical protein
MSRVLVANLTRGGTTEAELLDIATGDAPGTILLRIDDIVVEVDALELVTATVDRDRD